MLKQIVGVIAEKFASLEPLLSEFQGLSMRGTLREAGRRSQAAPAFQTPGP